jgi:hypothetical protein
VATLGVFALIDHRVNGVFRLKILHTQRDPTRCIYLDEYKRGNEIPIHDWHTKWLFQNPNAQKCVDCSILFPISEENHNNLCQIFFKQK